LNRYLIASEISPPNFHTIRDGTATVPNPHLSITPGEFARLRLVTSEPKPVLLLPAAAVLPDQSDELVMTVTADGTVVPKQVQIGDLYQGAADHPKRLEADRPGDHRRPDAGSAGCQGHGGHGRHHAWCWHQLARDAAMRFTHAFIDQPILATVVSVFITLIGLGALVLLPVAQYPEIVPPTVQVTTSYPGASADVVSKTVATPLEQEINGVENMLYMGSQSTGDGKLTITVTFRIGTDLNVAQMLTQNRVQDALPRLPEDVQRLGVQVRKATPNILLAVHLFSPDASRDVLYKVAAYKLDASEVLAALRAQNLQVSAGILNQPPTPGRAAYQLNVQTLGRLSTPEQFGDIIVKTDDQGRVTRIRDIGHVEIGAADYGSTAYMDRSNDLPLLIFAQPGANSLAVEHEVLSTMQRLKKDFPPGVDDIVIYDPTIFVGKSVHEVVTTIFVAILLVVGVVFLFLQTWRASIIPVIAIPVSLVGTFAVLYPIGISLNNLSLFGLVLAVGIVVDDAIVVVENVERNIRAGMSPTEAAHKTMDEVGGALVSIALTLCAVFVPSAFLSGISGQFFRQFAVTIAASTVISCFVSLTLSSTFRNSGSHT
jgi:multidrug efflux pump subunit AcrB